MRRRRVGDTPVEVSGIGFGCWIAGDGLGGSHENALRLMRSAFERGITFFDCDGSGDGREEELLSRFLKGLRRDQVQIGARFGSASEAQPAQPPGRSGRDLSPEAMRAELERLLRRLGSDHIDIYLVRDIKLPEFRDDLFGEFEKARAEGKIGTWGVSLGPGIGWREEGIRAMMDHGAKAVQTVYSLLEQDPGREFCDVGRAYRAGIIARNHDCGGILRKSDQVRFAGVRKYADAHGMTARQLAYRWLLMDPAVASIAATLANEEEIIEAVEAVDRPALAPQEMRRIAEDYAEDWGLGPEAHPRDLASSTSPTGKVRSGYVPPPVMLA